jgi:hypothetical protein
MLIFGCNKISFFWVLCIGVTLLTSNVIAATKKASSWLDEPITISFKNEPLSVVLEQISKRIGVSIAYNQELANEKVTGNYKNVKISDAITRLFRNENNSIQVNKAKKIIIVKTFGAKNYLLARAVDSKDHFLQQQIMGTDMTIAELNALNRKQLEHPEQTIGDNEVIMGTSGMTLNDLNNLHLQQFETLQSAKIDDIKIMGSDLTIQEIDKLSEQFIQEKETVKNKSLVMGTKMTLAQLDTFQEKQNRTLTPLDRENTLIMGTNITMGELDKLHTSNVGL